MGSLMPPPWSSRWRGVRAQVEVALAAAVGDRHRVEQADGLEFLRRQPPDSIHHVLFSPPYTDQRDYVEAGRCGGAITGVASPCCTEICDEPRLKRFSCAGAILSAEMGRTCYWLVCRLPAMKEENRRSREGNGLVCCSSCWGGQHGLPATEGREAAAARGKAHRAAARLEEPG